MGPNGKSESVGKLTPAVIGLAIDDVPINRRLFFLIFICMCGTLFDSFDNALLSYAMPGIRKDFQLNPAQLGLVGSAAQWGMAVGAYFWGWLGDRKGRVICLVLTILIFSLFTGFAARFQRRFPHRCPVHRRDGAGRRHSGRSGPDG